MVRAVPSSRRSSAVRSPLSLVISTRALAPYSRSSCRTQTTALPSRRAANAAHTIEQGTRSLGLLVEVNECGFSESDVRAICDLGASAKVREGAAAATGRKGLGFKSVFAICETAYLRSNGFSFRFDVTDSHGLYGALVPIWVGDDEWAASLPSGGALLRNEPGTTFWLPLSRASSRHLCASRRQRSSFCAGCES